MRIRWRGYAGVNYGLQRSGMVAPHVGGTAAASGKEPVHIPCHVGHAGETEVQAICSHDHTLWKLGEAVVQEVRVPLPMAKPAEASVECTRFTIKSADEPPVRRAAASVR